MDIYIKIFVLIMLIIFSVEDILYREISVKVILVFLLMGIGIRVYDNTLLSTEIFWGIFIGMIIIASSIILAGNIGVGDGIIFVLTGLFLGIADNLRILIFSVTISGIIGGLLIILKIKKKDYKMPFTVFILTFVALFVKLF